MGVDLHTLAAEPRNLPDLLQRIELDALEEDGQPKLYARDARHLKDLQRSCREANFKDAGAFALHYPHLLASPDRYGCTALHHAVMSDSPQFVTKLLKIYRDPRTFERRSVVFANEAQLLQDDFLLCLCESPWPPRGGGRDDAGSCSGSPSGSPSSRALSPAASPRERAVVVCSVGSSGLAGAAGVLPGDVLEASDFSGRVPMSSDRRPRQPLGSKEIMWARHENSASVLPTYAFPLRLKFTRPAHVGILTSDSWKFMDMGSGAMGANFRKIYKILLAEKRALTARPVPIRVDPPLCKDAVVLRKQVSRELLPPGARQGGSVAPPAKVCAGPPALDLFPADYSGRDSRQQRNPQRTRLPHIADASRRNLHGNKHRRKSVGFDASVNDSSVRLPTIGTR